jgi:addiction module HigA family antidote
MTLNNPHPGTIIHDEVMVPLRLSFPEAAATFGVSSEILAEVVAGNASITQELAEGLERSGFSTARFWVALQTRYDRSGDA